MIDPGKLRELLELQRHMERLADDLEWTTAARDKAIGEALAGGLVGARELGRYLGISGPRIVQINNRYRGLPKIGTDPRNPERQP